MFDNQRVTALRQLFVVMIAAVIAACAGTADRNARNNVGRALIAVVQVPSGAVCLEVSATGRTRAVSSRLDLKTGAPFSHELTRLPVGRVEFAAMAYPAACAEVSGASIATWVSDPLTLELATGQVTRVPLVLRPNGLTTVVPIWDADVPVPGPDQPLPIPGDVQQALSRLPYAEVDAVRLDGLPRSVTGNLALVPDLTVEAAQTGALSDVIAAVAPLFRLGSGDLYLESVSTDEQSHIHARLKQTKHGLPVKGGILLLHVDARGVVYSAGGTAFDGVDLSSEPMIGAEEATTVATIRPEFATATSSPPQLSYVISTRDEHLYLAYEVTVEGVGATGEPLGERVFVDALTGVEVDAWGLVPSALDRSVYESFSSIPSRSEGMAPIGNGVLDTNYDLLGDAYHCYSDLFGRDSYDGLGAPLRSTVNSYFFTCNAAWNGSAMIFGQPSAVVGCTNLAQSRDIVVHELTHGVTQYSTGLVYASESGALNEAFSDIFAAVCDSWKRGTIDGRTWLVSEDAFSRPYGLRSMSDPSVDGISRDFYPERYVGWSDAGGVHLNSGIANLAFRLLVTGGSHPRAKTSMVVPSIGMTKARDIFYRLNERHQLAEGAKFQDARASTLRLALQFHGASTRDSVQRAWDAVGVQYNVMYDNNPPSTPKRCDVTLSESSASYGFQGGSGTVRLTTTPSGCGWTTTTMANWITVEPPTSGQGSAELRYEVSSNPTSSRRVASLLVNGASLVVSQMGNVVTCVYVTSPDRASFGPSGGTGTATISTSWLCPWTVSNPVSWITLGSITGSGNGSVSYSVAANPGPAERSTALTVAGAPLEVTQAAPAARRTLSLTVLGDGSVTVGTQKCIGSSSCSLQFNSGTRLSLAAQGSTFRGWSGDCSTAGTNAVCALLLDVDRTVTADFMTTPSPEPSPSTTRTLSLDMDGSGTVTFSTGGSCSQSCTRTFPDGSKVTLTVTGGTFRYWGGNCAVNEVSTRCDLTMSQDRNVKALFTTSTTPPPSDPVPQPVFTWLHTSLSPTAFSVSSDDTYQLRIDITSSGVSGFARILREGTPRTEVARVDCRVAESATPPCTASQSVPLALVGRYLIDFQLFDLRTGGVTIGGYASLLL